MTIESQIAVLAFPSHALDWDILSAKSQNRNIKKDRELGRFSAFFNRQLITRQPSIGSAFFMIVHESPENQVVFFDTLIDGK